MLQRIQSVFLAIVAIASVMVFFFPLADYYHEYNGNYQFFIYGVRCMDPEPKVVFSQFFTIPLIALAAASFLFALTALFSYKNRSLQIRICSFNLIINVVLVAVIFFFYATRIQSMTQIEPNYRHLGILFPLVSILCLILGTRAIRKDENLVKSADRLR